MNIPDLVADLKKRSTKGGDIDAVYFIACGGSLAGLYAAKYLLERETRKIKVALYNSSEFLQTTPKSFTENSIAVCCTLRGTPETEEAIEFCKAKGAYTISIIGDGNDRMVRASDYVIRFKTVADDATPMLSTNISQALWLSFEILHQFEQYEHYDDAIQAFGMLENIADKIRNYCKPRAQIFAKSHQKEQVIYVMAGAPSMGVAYAFSICSLMEIQWIHSPTVNSAEFFHGPFEVLDKNIPFLHLISDGRSRPEDMRADAFLKKYGEKVTSIDARELFFDQIRDSVKEYFNHIVFDVALRQYLTPLAEIRQHPKDLRRYMWKLQY